MRKKRYIIFNKPYGVLSQFTSEDHETLASFGLPSFVYAAGRLDKDSEGLLLLSDDGPFIKTFLDDHPRIYWVQVENIPDEVAVKKLATGVMIKSGLTSPCEIRTINDPELYERVPPIRQRKSIPTSWLELILREGKNRQVRKMTAAVGHPTLRLFRAGVGAIHIDKIKLKPGEWLEVKKEDIIS